MPSAWQKSWWILGWNWMILWFDIDFCRVFECDFWGETGDFCWFGSESCLSCLGSFTVNVSKYTIHGCVWDREYHNITHISYFNGENHSVIGLIGFSNLKGQKTLGNPILLGWFKRIQSHFKRGLQSDCTKSYINQPNKLSLLRLCEEWNSYSKRISLKNASGRQEKILQESCWSNSCWSFQPIWKNISQTGSFPQVGVKIKKYLKPPSRIGSAIPMPFFLLLLLLLLCFFSLSLKLKKSWTFHL